MTELTFEMLPEAAELFTRVFNGEPWNDSWTPQQSLDRLTDIFNTPRYVGAAYFEDGKMVGLIMGRGEVYFDGEHFQILEFCVDAKYQGRGIGGKMLAEFCTLLAQRGVVYVHLITMRNERTEGFYSKKGFSTDVGMCLMTNKLC